MQAHPNYLVASYRLAVEASLVAERIVDWRGTNRANKEEICMLLWVLPGELGEAAAKALGYDPARETVRHDKEDLDKAKIELVKLGLARARALATGLSPWNLLVGMLCRRERRANFALLRPDVHKVTPRRRMLDLGKSVEVIAEIREEYFEASHGSTATCRMCADAGAKKARRSRSPENELVKRAEQPTSGWQLAYNVACLYAVRARVCSCDCEVHYVDRAFEFLWHALERPGSAKLTANWLELDPDLDYLVTDSRFDDLRSRTGGVSRVDPRSRSHWMSSARWLFGDSKGRVTKLATRWWQERHRAE